MTILFVCTGNTCRSPMAWAFWRALQERGEVPSDWRAFSAGASPSVGEAASRHAVEIACGWGIGLSSHRSRAVDAEALRQADVCVAVSPSHARAVRAMLRSAGAAPGRAPRVLCLCDFLSRSSDEPLARLLGSAEATEIADPYGGSREAYESCARLIEQAVSNLALHLREEGAASEDAEPEQSAPEPT